jgi:hypothetical protein
LSCSPPHRRICPDSLGKLTLPDDDVQVTVPVREGGAKRRCGRTHALAIVRHARRWIVINEILGEELVHRSEVALGEQSVDE